VLEDRRRRQVLGLQQGGGAARPALGGARAGQARAVGRPRAPGARTGVVRGEEALALPQGRAAPRVRLAPEGGELGRHGLQPPRLLLALALALVARPQDAVAP